MDQVTSMTETFTLYFESLAHPGHVSIAELASFLYLAGLNRGEFCWALDELLHNNPTGRFPNPTVPMSKLQSWKISSSLFFTREVRVQDSAPIAFKPLNPSNRPHPPATKAPRPHLYPTPCTWCLNADKVQWFGHLSSHCSKNPNRLPGPTPPPSNPPPTPPPPSHNSQRLHALLSQLDLADSNSVMLLIAEAAIEASDYLDSA